ncbi:response regulator [Mastigocoleus sp. MO_188.B34]|uniref:response regulator n=1 Tax=Mastigocoleus sp. MO_188.B34 TaxID=3036635 RepID=UPI002638FCF6|nr:response regulator [Mastigocoleus sp. MO_188.B34]MDJ0697350.1 response regulator [Mastigocoleus sp. MO_188.B34]
MTAQLLVKNEQYWLQQPRRILLVEDHQINRMLLSDYLNYCGYHIKSLSGGIDFFSTIESFDPHLILLDLKLPDLDGYSLLEEFKQKDKYARIPIFIVSALAFKTDEERAMKLGASRYFVKPINLINLSLAIKEAFTSCSSLCI